MMDLAKFIASIEEELGFRIPSMARVHYMLNSNEKNTSLKNEILLNLWLSAAYFDKNAKNLAKNHLEQANNLFKNFNQNERVKNFLFSLQELITQFPLAEEETKFSTTEKKLILFLKEKRRDASELINHLYGTDVNYIKIENRLKNLLFRLRKKIPGKISFRQGYYYWVD